MKTQKIINIITCIAEKRAYLTHGNVTVTKGGKQVNYGEQEIVIAPRLLEQEDGSGRNWNLYGTTKHGETAIFFKI